MHEARRLLLILVLTCMSLSGCVALSIQAPSEGEPKGPATITPVDPDDLGVGGAAVGVSSAALRFNRPLGLNPVTVDARWTVAATAGSSARQVADLLVASDITFGDQDLFPALPIVSPATRPAKKQLLLYVMPAQPRATWVSAPPIARFSVTAAESVRLKKSPDGYLIAPRDRAELAIIGATQRGLLYGVIDFLKASPADPTGARTFTPARVLNYPDSVTRAALGAIAASLSADDPATGAVENIIERLHRDATGDLNDLTAPSFIGKYARFAHWLDQLIWEKHTLWMEQTAIASALSRTLILTENDLLFAPTHAGTLAKRDQTLAETRALSDVIEYLKIRGVGTSLKVLGAPADVAYPAYSGYIAPPGSRTYDPSPVVEGLGVVDLPVRLLNVTPTDGAPKDILFPCDTETCAEARSAKYAYNAAIDRIDPIAMRASTGTRWQTIRNVVVGGRTVKQYNPLTTDSWCATVDETAVVLNFSQTPRGTAEIVYDAPFVANRLYALVADMYSPSSVVATPTGQTCTGSDTLSAELGECAGLVTFGTGLLTAANARANQGVRFAQSYFRAVSRSIGGKPLTNVFRLPVQTHDTYDEGAAQERITPSLTVTVAPGVCLANMQLVELDGLYRAIQSDAALAVSSFEVDAADGSPLDSSCHSTIASPPAVRTELLESVAPFVIADRQPAPSWSCGETPATVRYSSATAAGISSLNANGRTSVTGYETSKFSYGTPQPYSPDLYSPEIWRAESPGFIATFALLDRTDIRPDGVPLKSLLSPVTPLLLANYTELNAWNRSLGDWRDPVPARRRKSNADVTVDYLCTAADEYARFWTAAPGTYQPSPYASLRWHDPLRPRSCSSDPHPEALLMVHGDVLTPTRANGGALRSGVFYSGFIGRQSDALMSGRLSHGLVFMNWEYGASANAVFGSSNAFTSRNYAVIGATSSPDPTDPVGTTLFPLNLEYWNALASKPSSGRVMGTASSDWLALADPYGDGTSAPCREESARGFWQADEALLLAESFEGNFGQPAIGGSWRVSAGTCAPPLATDIYDTCWHDDVYIFDPGCVSCAAAGAFDTTRVVRLDRLDGAWEVHVEATLRQEIGATSDVTTTITFVDTRGRVLAVPGATAMECVSPAGLGCPVTTARAAIVQRADAADVFYRMRVAVPAPRTATGFLVSFSSGGQTTFDDVVLSQARPQIDFPQPKDVTRCPGVGALPWP